MAQIPYLDVQKLSKRFGAQTLFNEISFSIAEGQHVGLIAEQESLPYSLFSQEKKATNREPSFIETTCV